MKSIKMTIGIILSIIVSQITFAQISAEVSVTNMYDDNVNNNAEQWKSNVSMLNVTAGYLIEGETSGLHLSYDGAFNYYESVLSRTNQFHSANITYTSLSGDEGENRFRFAGSYGYGFNRDMFTLFDHSLATVAGEYKYFLFERLISTTGYSFRSVTFPQLNEFSYTEHAVMLKGAFAFTQKTTAILQGDLGTKFYSANVSSNGSSMRKGMMASFLPSVTQMTGMVKVGQGITDQIGMSATARYQWNLQKQTRYLSSDYGLISDDELFDDHYGYEGLHTSLQYTQLLSETVIGKLTGGIQNRLYSTLSAFDRLGNFVADQRTDVRSYINFLLEKQFVELGFSLKASLDLIDNSSNDAYYDYNNTAVTMEIGIPF
ncbi:MAG: hypothetical protein WCX28_06210 [Bacteriovoracaceae bacterium]|nr:hypothetical protein [Bacteroidota bacterium]